MPEHVKPDGSVVATNGKGVITGNRPAPACPPQSGATAHISAHPSVLRRPAHAPADTAVDLDEGLRRLRAADSQAQAAGDALDRALNPAPPVPAGHRLDTSYPFPQANSIAKIAAALEAIHDRADTDEAIAAAIAVSPRQGAYYGTALGYLGFARDGGTPRTWELTPNGADFLDADPHARVAILANLVDQIPVSDDADLADDVIRADSTLGSTTAERRATTISSWRAALADPSAAEDQMRLEGDGMRENLAPAQALATAARERSRARTTPPPRRPACPDCFMEMPATGTCDCA